jgi:putative membrane protein
LILVVPAAWPAAPVLIVIAILFGIDAYTLAGLRIDPSRIVLRTRRLGSSVTLIARRRRLQSSTLSRTPFQRHADLSTFAVTVARGTRVRIHHLDRPRAQRAFDVL